MVVGLLVICPHCYSARYTFTYDACTPVPCSNMCSDGGGCAVSEHFFRYSTPLFVLIHCIVHMCPCRLVRMVVKV